ncbi:MAG TPA: hypothetical protein VFC51_10575, partial [Chloroflexota bacterium]|nr:hypothetical protein [Chloroflexota bacterium]
MSALLQTLDGTDTFYKTRPWGGQFGHVRGPTDPIHPGRERYARYVAALYESAQFASGAGMERYREWWPFDPP